MRIIAGAAKGTTLKVPSDGTRPMTGRAKESLFSVLIHDLPSARVLDLYAGSGGLGLEALSRGAASAVFVEQGRKALECLRSNVEAVGLGGDVVARSVESAHGTVGDGFTLVFADPPYPMSDKDVEKALSSYEENLAEGAIVVLHRQARSQILVPDFLTSRDKRRYGDAVVTILERTTS